VCVCVCVCVYLKNIKVEKLCKSAAAVALTCDINFLKKLFKNESYFCYYLQEFILL